MRASADVSSSLVLACNFGARAQLQQSRELPAEDSRQAEVESSSAGTVVPPSVLIGPSSWTGVCHEQRDQAADSPHPQVLVPKIRTANTQGLGCRLVAHTTLARLPFVSPRALFQSRWSRTCWMNLTKCWGRCWTNPQKATTGSASSLRASMSGRSPPSRSEFWVAVVRLRVGRQLLVELNRLPWHRRFRVAPWLRRTDLRVHLSQPMGDSRARLNRLTPCACRARASEAFSDRGACPVSVQSLTAEAIPTVRSSCRISI
jgi:hypothetical protein